MAGTPAISATWSAARFGGDQDAFLTLRTPPKPNGFVQLVGRLNTLGTAGVSCYFVRVSGAGVWELRKRVNGASSV
jgi:hypothetical protein